MIPACASSSDDDGIDSANAEVNGAVAFTETTERALADQGCGNGSDKGCYTNYAVVADLDGDGHFDILMGNGGDHFFPGAAEPQALFFGDGKGKFADGLKSLAGIEKSIVRQFAIADFDGDGRLDVYMPGGYGNTDDQIFFQTAPRKFDKDDKRLPTKRSTAGAVHAGDIDNDGDMDIVIADWGKSPNPDAEGTSPVKIRIFENDGKGKFKAGPVLDAPDGSTATDIDLQDVDGDFALDIILTNRNGQSRLYLNDGKGEFKDVTKSKAFPKKQGPFTFNAELCDVNGDGHLDILFDGGANNLGNHATQLLINDGTGKFVDRTEQIVGEPSSDDNQVKCVDVDNDGDFDLIVASLTNRTEKLLQNTDGKGNFKFVPTALPALGDPTLSIDVGDFDGDGKTDLMTAQGEVHGEPFLDRIFKNGTAKADKNKPVFRKVEKPKAAANKPTILRLAVTDAHTSETGQHLKSVGLEVTIDGKKQALPAQFIGGDLFRVEIPAQPSGKTIKVKPVATDRSGNDGAGEAFEIKVGD